MKQRLFSLRKACMLGGCALTLLICLPSFAFAWGPGVHMNTAQWVFANLTLLPTMVAAVIGAHKKAFLYGCLAPDIFIGKGCAATPGHSHNWITGREVLSRSTQPHLTAFAYGYMAHLAADTVAHNTYVPSLMSATPTSGKGSHVYIEAQADRLVRWDTAGTVGLFDRSHRDAEGILLQVTGKKRLSFNIKKKVYQQSVAVSGDLSWKRSMRLAHKVTPAVADHVYLHAMLDASRRAVMSVLMNGGQSPVVGVDPIGEQALLDAKARCQGRSVMAFRQPYPLHFPLDSRIASLP